jgi:hypothetical protein
MFACFPSSLYNISFCVLRGVSDNNLKCIIVNVCTGSFRNANSFTLKSNDSHDHVHNTSSQSC